MSRGYGCENCHHWGSLRSESGWGRCHTDEPACGGREATRQDGRFIGVWPVTFKSDYCGHWTSPSQHLIAEAC